MAVVIVGVVAIDGRTLRRSLDRADDKAAIHMISAWAAHNRVVFGQLAVGDQTNEITAIPTLPAMLDIKGLTVTIGCQKAIDEQIEKGHGRVEKRRTCLIREVPWLIKASSGWKGLRGIVMIEREGAIGQTTTLHRHYYITSLDTHKASEAAQACRAHWGVENGLHWTLDVEFNEDRCRIRQGHAAQNFSRLRRIALNLLKSEKTVKAGIRAKSKTAGWDGDNAIALVYADVPWEYRRVGYTRLMSHQRVGKAVARAWLVVVCAGFAVVLGAAGMDGADAAGDTGSTSALAAPTAAIRYDRDIRPLLSDRCFKCHGPDAAARKADLRLDQFETATADLNGIKPIVPGDVEGSELWKRMTSTDPEEQMPPPGSNKRTLSPEERELVRRWIAEGAKYEPHWSFVPPVKGIEPEVGSAAWCRNDIDRFILARLEHEGVAPAPEADAETLVRRVFLDLTGLPPTPEELDAYLADATPDRYEKLVDRLMTIEPYRSRMAERLATPWLDAARYGDTCGIHTDNGRQIWAWRDWVLGAFRDNMPYDRFVIEQLAGDLLPNATLEQKVASGFNRNHVTSDEGGAIAEEYLVEYAVDRAATTATTFLGLTMGCARCHDHKFDPISQQEFYNFYAFFDAIEEPGLYSQTPDSNRAHEPFIEVPTPEQESRLAALHGEVDGLKKLQVATTPEEDRAHGAFLADFPREAGIRWAESSIVGAKAESATKLTIQPDGSVLASGDNPPTDVHQITLHPEKGDKDLDVVVLEALEDPSLGQGRVGRAPNGNAVITAVEIESFERSSPEKTQRHEAEWLWGDISQMNGDFRFTNLLVGNKGSDRGWAVAGHEQAGPRHLILMLKEPIPASGERDVRITLRYESVFAQHVFGRVRLTLGSIADGSKLPLEMSNFWLVGPFPQPAKGTSYETMFGPESATTIDFAQNFGSGNQFWRYDANLRDGATVPLAVGTNVTFLGRLIASPVARDLPVSLGSDDGFVLYVNGKEVARHEIDRAVAPDQDKAVIPLRPGVNLVVLKIVNTGGESGYYFKSGEPTGDAYPHDLVAALLPERCRTPQMADRIKLAWRANRSPEYRQRQARIEQIDRDEGALHSMVAKTMVMKELDTPRPTFVLKRGQYDQPDKAKPAARAVPASLGKLPEGAPANRLGLAQWLVSPQNPLAARVQANRLWELVFGAGLERTSEDFGQQGEWPSHPELLDFLAADFRDGGWDMRRMIRMMVTSATYRQSSDPRPELMEKDPENRLLAHGPRHRMSAEQVRDQALYVSGLLVEKFGGPSVKTYQPDGLWKEGALPSSNTQVYERGKGDDLYRRSLYTYWKRAVPPPAMLAFDAPTREFCVVRRPITSTPLQALVLWNDPQFVEASRVLAQRTMAEPGDEHDRLARMFRRCTGRRPTEKELTALGNALASWRGRYNAAPDDAAKLLAVGDKPVSEKADKPELASWTMTAASVMNLYQATTEE